MDTTELRIHVMMAIHLYRPATVEWLQHILIQRNIPEAEVSIEALEGILKQMTAANEVEIRGRATFLTKTGTAVLTSELYKRVFPENAILIPR